MYEDFGVLNILDKQYNNYKYIRSRGHYSAAGSRSESSASRVLLRVCEIKICAITPKVVVA